MKHKLSILIMLTITMFVAFNCGTTGTGRGDSKRCEPKWYGDRLTGEGIIFGVGLGETSNRRVAKDLSWSSAAADVNAQIRSRVINEIEANFTETYIKVDGEDARRFIDGVKNNLYSKTDSPLDGCITEKFADCDENNVWSAYTLVKFDFNGWRKTILRNVLDKEISKASDEIKAQSDSFRERFNIE